MKATARHAIAYHEAGHAMAVWHYGLKLKRATIVPTAEFKGIVQHESPLKGIRLDIDGSDRASIRAEKSIVICLAGPAAQRRFAKRSWRGYHGRSDFEQAADLAIRLQGSGEIATAYLRYLQLVAEQLVQANWRFVQIIAEALLERGFLAGDEIIPVINQATRQHAGPAEIVLVDGVYHIRAPKRAE